MDQAEQEKRAILEELMNVQVFSGLTATKGFTLDDELWEMKMELECLRKRRLLEKRRRIIDCVLQAQGWSVDEASEKLLMNPSRWHKLKFALDPPLNPADLIFALDKRLEKRERVLIVKKLEEGETPDHSVFALVLLSTFMDLFHKFDPQAHEAAVTAHIATIFKSFFVASGERSQGEGAAD